MWSSCVLVLCSSCVCWTSGVRIYLSNRGTAQTTHSTPTPQRRRGSVADPISTDDVVRAVEKLKVLGGGFGLVTVGAQQYVRSVPGELNLDKNRVLEVAQVCVYVVGCGMSGGMWKNGLWGALQWD